jgi:hypothetical protein
MVPHEACVAEVAMNGEKERLFALGAESRSREYLKSNVALIAWGSKGRCGGIWGGTVAGD